MADTVTITLGDRTFTLDREKAEEAYAAKKVINGRHSMFFNILPLKYQWAYNLYKEMKNAHWEPAETSLQRDISEWPALNEPSQMLFKMALGTLAKSQEMFKADTIYTIRDLITAPELKLVFGRFVHEENTRSDVLVYLHGALEINPMECALLAHTPAVAAKKQFLDDSFSAIDRDTDTTVTANKQAIARDMFLINHCMEGTQFFSLYAVIFSLATQNKLPGAGAIFNKFLGDVCFRISLFDKLLKELCEENPDVWTQEFQDELVDYMEASVKLEKDLIASLPVADAGLDPEALGTYIEFLADERLTACGLPRQYHHASSPFPWLDEQIHLINNQHAHIGASTLDSFDDDDL
ncbi:MAG: ribonucleotide-diphosphate reductase subunit beta [Akkermansiaceae bacterium]